jgi:hypothetical protein
MIPVYCFYLELFVPRSQPQNHRVRTHSKTDEMEFIARNACGKELLEGASGAERAENQ